MTVPGRDAVENYVLYVKVIVTIGAANILAGSLFAAACSLRAHFRRAKSA